MFIFYLLTTTALTTTLNYKQNILWVPESIHTSKNFQKSNLELDTRKVPNTSKDPSENVTPQPRRITIKPPLSHPGGLLDSGHSRGGLKERILI